MSDRLEFEVGDGAALDVRVESGSLEVRTGEPGRIRVSIGEHPDHWNVRAMGDTVVVSPLDRWRSRSARMVCEVPEGCRLTARAATARIRADGTFGDVEVIAASGDVTVGAVRSVSVTTASGDVRVGEVVGDAEIKTVAGDIDVGSVAGRLAVTTTSGDVRVGPIGDDVGVRTTSGDVDIARIGGSAVAVQTVSGDVSLRLPSGIRVSPDLRTFSGRTLLPDRRPDASSSAGIRPLVRVAVKTVSGDITIDRAD